MKRLNLACLGFGNAGRAFAELLLEKQEALRAVYGTDVRITAISTATRGSLSDPEGIDLSDILSQLASQGRFSPETPGYGALTPLELLESADYDAVLEITPLDVFTGQPALDHIRKAMGLGKHVITANKGPLAHGARELQALAATQGVRFFYETTVMDGTPVFNLAEETLPMCRVTEIQGILNTTTNFVLEEMAAGRSYEDAMAEGRRRGFVEADPSLDIDGWDAAAKLTALMNVLMGEDLRPQDIQRTGISGITAGDIAEADANGQVIKLLCRGFLENGKAQGIVCPERLPKTHPYAAINGTSSVVSLTTDLMGTVTVIEHDPEIQQTAFGLFSDLVRLIRALS